MPARHPGVRAALRAPPACAAQRERLEAEEKARQEYRRSAFDQARDMAMRAREQQVGMLGRARALFGPREQYPEEQV